MVTPFDGAGPGPQHVSRDGHRILATVELTRGPSEFAALTLTTTSPETATRAIARAERVLWPVVSLLLVLVSAPS